MRLPDVGRACHPKIRSTSVRHFDMHERHLTSASAGDAVDLVFGKALTSVSSSPVPRFVDGATVRARRFDPLISLQALAEASADTDLISVGKSSGTWSILYRATSEAFTSPSRWYLFSLSGNGTSTAQRNLRSLSLTSAGLQYRWENGSTVSGTFSGFTPRFGEWTYLTLRTTVTTAGDGPTGRLTLDLFVNGSLVDTITNVQNSAGGTSAVLRLGHELDNTTIKNVGAIDVGGLYVDATALSDTQIAEDARRIRGLVYAVRLDASVKVLNVDDVPVHLDDVDGVDFLDDVQIDRDLDQSADTARITLGREQGSMSLATLRTDAKPNLRDVGSPTGFLSALLREDQSIDVRVAEVPVGLCASVDELWRTSRFHGAVDEIDVSTGTDQITLTCRDDAGRFVDTYIEQEVDYGDDDSPLAAEGEMQAILNDNDNDATNNSATLTARTGSYNPTTLHVVGTPTLGLVKWRQRREPVMSALKTIANISAWDVRFLYSQNPYVRDWRLTYFEPDFERVDVDVVLGPDDISAVRSLKQSTYGRRTHCRVIYPSVETSLPTPSVPAGYTVTNSGWNNVDGQEQRNVAFVEIQSDAALAATGKRQFMEVQENQSTQISTMAEAVAMCLGILRAVEDPGIAKSATLPCLIDLELNDRIHFQPIKQLFTVDQRLTVKRLTHSISEDASTSIELRGQPSLGFKRMLRLEARPGQGRPGVMDPRDALTDFTTGSMLSLYRNLLDRSSYLIGGKFIQIRNSDFASFSAGLGHPPDGWTVSAGTWGTDVSVESGIQLSGLRAIKIASTSGALTSDFIPVVDDIHTPYSAEIAWQWPTGASALPAAPKPVEMLIVWYDEDKTTVVASRVVRPGEDFKTVPGYQPDEVAVVADMWFKSRVDGISPPGGAKFVKLTLRQSTNGLYTANSGGVLIDNVSFYRGAREMKTFNASLFTITGGSAGNTSWYAVNLDRSSYVNAVHDFGHNAYGYSSPNTVVTMEDDSNVTIISGAFKGSGFYCHEAGSYLVTASIALECHPGAGTPASTLSGHARIVKNAEYASSSNPLNTSGEVVQQAVGSPWVPITDWNNGSTAGYTNGFVSTCSMSFRVHLNAGDRLSLEFLRLVDGGGNLVSPIPASVLTDVARGCWMSVRLGLAE